MSNSYDDFLRRFVLYRTRMNMSQEEMGKLLGKTQSQLSKIELRKTVVSFDMLESRLADYLIENAGKNRRALKELAVWMIGLEFQKCGGFPDADSEFEYRMLTPSFYF